MPNIEINFQKFLPSLGTFYSYFEILKAHNYIQDIEIVHQDGMPKIKVFRKEEMQLPL